MKKEDFESKINEIGTCEDEATRRELLTQLKEDVGKDYDTIAELTTSNASLVNDNEALRSANMKLFLRVGTDKVNTKDVDTEPKPKRSFDNLFNEKGGIK